MIVRLAASAMGTRFELVLGGEDEVSLRAAGEEAIEEIEGWDRRLSAFRPDSVTSQLNRDAFDRAVVVDEGTFALLGLCGTVWRESGGTFDPTVGPLMEAWRFRDDGDDRGDVGADEAELCRRADEALGRVGFSRVELDAACRSVRATSPGVRFDFGGVGKGWALDRAGELLREAGVARALLHGGTSSVLAIGSPGDRAGFRVAIAAPEGAGEAGMPRGVELADGALGVSAPHGRAWRDARGKVLGHVIDPRSGRPCGGASIAVVAGPSAAMCDAWSTSALVHAAVPPGLPAGYSAWVG